MSSENSIYAKQFRKLRKLYADYSEYLDDTKPLRRCGMVARDGGKLFSVTVEERCGCPVLWDGLNGPISATWCHCCKGSLLSVYRYVFPDRTRRMEIAETVAAGGKRLCFCYLI